MSVLSAGRWVCSVALPACKAPSTSRRYVSVGVVATRIGPKGTAFSARDSYHRGKSRATGRLAADCQTHTRCTRASVGWAGVSVMLLPPPRLEIPLSSHRVCPAGKLLLMDEFPRPTTPSGFRDSLVMLA